MIRVFAIAAAVALGAASLPQSSLTANAASGKAKSVPPGAKAGAAQQWNGAMGVMQLMPGTSKSLKNRRSTKGMGGKAKINQHRTRDERFRTNERVMTTR